MKSVTVQRFQVHIFFLIKRTLRAETFIKALKETKGKKRRNQKKQKKYLFQNNLLPRQETSVLKQNI